MNHLCFSGSPACSGCNPCVSCADIVNERVLPAATIAAGLHGSLLALVHLFAQQLYRMGVDPANLALSQTGVPLSTVFAKPEDQVQAFMTGYREAWGRLIQAMSQDPTLASRLIRTEVGTPPVGMSEEAIQEMLRSRGYTAGPPVRESVDPQVSEPVRPQTSGPADPPTPPAPPTPPTPPAPPASTASYEAFVRKAREGTPPGNTEPMDAEDVAAAALAVDTANGALTPQPSSG